MAGRGGGGGTRKGLPPIVGDFLSSSIFCLFKGSWLGYFGRWIDVGVVGVNEKVNGWVRGGGGVAVMSKWVDRRMMGR